MILYIIKAAFASLIISVVGCGLWLLLAKVFTGGQYSMNYWAAVQVWFWILFIIDILSGLYRYGTKDFTM